MTNNYDVYIQKIGGKNRQLLQSFTDSKKAQKHFNKLCKLSRKENTAAYYYKNGNLVKGYYITKNYDPLLSRDFKPVQ